MDLGASIAWSSNNVTGVNFMVRNTIKLRGNIARLDGTEEGRITK
jgi:hypothetical protein